MPLLLTDLFAGGAAGSGFASLAPGAVAPPSASSKGAPSYFPELMRRPVDPSAPLRMPDYVPQAPEHTTADASSLPKPGAAPTLKNNVPLAVGIVITTVIAVMMIRKATD